MFSLIITIISIALVAALALATIYYGGSAFNKGGAEAKASQFINEGQQISGAAQLAKTDVENGTNQTLDLATDTVADLAPAYLAQVPGTWVSTAIEATGAAATSPVPSNKVCEAINTKAGVSDVTAPTQAEKDAKAFYCDANVITYKL